MIKIEKTTNREFYSEFEWLTRAMSDDKTRDAIKDKVAVYDGYAYAADGYRVHTLAVNFDEGIYAVIKTKDAYLLELLPDYKGFPSKNMMQSFFTKDGYTKLENGFYGEDIGYIGLDKKNDARFDGLYAAIVKASGHVINSTILKDALLGQSLECFIKDPGQVKPIILEDTTHGVAFMPICQIIRKG